MSSFCSGKTSERELKHYSIEEDPFAMLVSIPFLAVAISIGSSIAADIPANSAHGRELLTAAGADRDLQQDGSMYFLSQYSVKFQGCHHIQQWNNNADDGSDVRIMTKRLARFRLCPSEDCSSDKSVGCRSKYGDYIVDMDTFLQAYMQSFQQEREEQCGYAQENCNNQCGDDNANGDCWSSCYQAYRDYDCQQYGQNQGFQVQQYMQCQQIQLNNNYDQTAYYIGAYCADQGGEIRLGIFTDDTCTTFAQNGAELFYKSMGFELPYSSSSLVSTKCLTCSQSNGNGNYQNREVCSDVYQVSGKCETRMSIDYPNESSCNYIEGVKIIRNDGVIRTSTRGKSKAAAVAIGLFTTLSVLLGGYVFYLRTKLARAQINLAAASDSLVP